MFAEVVNAGIIPQLFKDVDEGRRRCNTLVHGKTQAMCLIGVVVGVLSQNDYFYICIRRILKRIENVVHIGIDGMGAVFLNEELPQVLIGFGLNGILKQVIPVVSDMNHKKTILSVGCFAGWLQLIPIITHSFQKFNRQNLSAVRFSTDGGFFLRMHFIFGNPTEKCMAESEKLYNFLKSY